MKYIESIKMQVIVILIMQGISLALIAFLGLMNIALALFIYLVVNMIMMAWIVFTLEKAKVTQDVELSRILGNEAKDALSIAKIGIIAIDNNRDINWISDFLQQRGIKLIGKKMSAFVEETSQLFEQEIDSVIGEHDGYLYEITRRPSSSIFYVRDVSELETLSRKYEEDSVVVGIVHLDNYMEISSYEDEARMTQINVGLRQPIIAWADRYGMLIRRLRSDRFIVVLNEKVYKQLVEDKFDILNDTRKEADALDISITLSMAFARGSDDLSVLDGMSNDLLELAQSRGGDQVAVKRYGNDVEYYGGNSEAVSKRSRVRVRVMAQAIKEAIMESDRVFITGHKNMDFDCMGANIALSRIAQACGKQTYIVSKSGGIEMYLQNALECYSQELETRHVFINEEDALRYIGKNDLVLVADYHNPTHSNAPMLLDASNRIIVVDHHRRTENYIQKPLLVYIESGASSTCELLTECLEYVGSDVEINETEAMFMYLGILVDTNRFKMRTGFRTFEAAALLKKMGVDPIVAEDLLREDLIEFESKVTIFKFAHLYQDKYMISCVDEHTQLSRTMMSIGADALLEIKNVEASFVISKANKESTAISARSKGNVNVQRIMEEMHGGGHFSAAATQIEGATPMQLNEELMQHIDTYISSQEEENESNIIE